MYQMHFRNFAASSLKTRQREEGVGGGHGDKGVGGGNCGNLLYVDHFIWTGKPGGGRVDDTPLLHLMLPLNYLESSPIS